MFRKLFKNKETGEQLMLWVYFIDVNPHYFKDVSLKLEIDISDYEEINDDNNIANLRTPYQLFGVECERGWYHLLQPVIDYIDNYNADKDKDNMIYITQIKEKFGLLCIYVNFGTAELFSLIEDAEKKSENICEFCGTEKNVGTTLGWEITICHDCLKKRCKSRNESVKWCNYNDNKIYWVNPDGDDKFIETKEEYEENLP